MVGSRKEPSLTQTSSTQKAGNTLLPRVIAVTSGKGGVGKSSITVNLGISLAKTGAKVCVFDADTGLANANILLGLTPEFSLEHVLYGAKAIEDIMLDGPHGMKIIPGANGISECVNLHPRQQLRLTRELARIETEFDYMLIDTAAGIADSTLDFVSAAHHTLVVITPEPTSLTDAFSLVKLLQRRDGNKDYQVLVNMCGSMAQAKEVYHRFAAAVEKYVGVKIYYFGHILRDESMRAAVVLQNPVAMFPDNDPSCRSFLKLADQLDIATRSGTISTSFSAYWHRQYKYRRKDADDKKKGGSPAQEVIEQTSALNRDNEYLSELRSRLLLLIEQGNADSDRLQSLLHELIESFYKRYDDSPINLVSLIEQLIRLPERDDQELREIAEKVWPWAPSSTQPPFDELSARKPIEPGVESEGDELSEAEPEPEPKGEGDQHIEQDGMLLVPDEEQAPVPFSEQPAIVESEPELDTRNAATVSSEASQNLSGQSAGGQEYDSSRFGSQENLLDLLRRYDSGEKSLAELIGSLK